MPGTRRLAAIMFSDMVGFSALTQQNEALALRLLGEHNEIFRETLRKYEGREVKSTGDGFLIEFPSALTAVKCAIDVQQAMHDRNLIEQERIEVRIGIHVGDIVSKDGDIFGDGVNIAARIEPLADAGGICVSDVVAHQIHNKIDNTVASIGKAELKNIELPLNVHKVCMPWESHAPVRKAVKTRKPAILGAAVVTAMVVVLIGGGLIARKGAAGTAPVSKADGYVRQAEQLIDDPLVFHDPIVNAKQLCERAIDLEPMNGEAYATMARATVMLLANFHDDNSVSLSDAVNFANRAKQYSPESLETGLSLVDIELFKKDPKAYDMLLELNKKFPKNIRVLQRLAFSATLFANRSEFEKWSHEAGDIGQNAYAFMNMGTTVLMRDNQMGEALSLTKRSLKAKPSSIGYFNRMLALVSGAGDLEGAKGVLSQLPSELAQQDHALAVAFTIWLWSRDPEEAYDILKFDTSPFVDAFPAPVPTDYLRGRAYLLAGRKDAAKEQFNKALAAVDERLKSASDQATYVGWKAELLGLTGDRKRGREQERLAESLGAAPSGKRFLALGEQDKCLDFLDNAITNRVKYGLFIYNEARLDPAYDPLRKSKRFEEIMQNGEAWLNQATGR
ncbi:MAG TPA: adenylate/guanylate cyclase domain-containing protein [Fimbriimonadaceae bacterium]|nr:adenylate/guanylate cyclase domain-containing protein [Fimbriimonadaceae bacterium]